MSLPTGPVATPSRPAGSTPGPRGSEPSRHWTGAPHGEDTDPLLGTTLAGSYQIVGMLAEGGMGRVYEARHTRIPGKRLTVKVLHEEFVHRPEALERFQREAEAAAAVPSPFVVRVYDVHRTADGRPFLVAEYLDGVELGEHLDAVGRLPTAVAVRVARQLCKGLGAAHRAGIVHRDMKPENVFLTGDLARPVAKLLDFGISRLAHKTDSRLTQAGAIIGTPAYMSPEQACAKDVDLRADVYGVGAILYRALTGRAPFDPADPTATILAVATEDPPRPRAVAPDVPEELELVVQRAMAKNASDRYASTDELDAALAPFDLHDEGAARPVRTGADVSGARGKLAVYLVVTALATLAAATSAVAGVFAAARGGTLAALPSPTEMALVLLALAGVLVTPAVLYALHLRRAVWNDTPRVVERLAAVRPVLLAALAAYGLAALAVGVADVVVAPLAGTVGRPFGLDAPIWWALLALVGALAAGATVLSRRAGAWARRPWQRFVAGPLVALVAMAGSGAALYGGFALRGAGATPPDRAGTPEAPAGDALGSAADATGAQAVESGPARTAPTAPTPSAAATPTPAPSAPAPEPSAPPVEGASERELTAALDDPAALAVLASRYPDDPAVLGALALAHGKAVDYGAAMDAAARAFALAPELAGQRRMRLVVAAAAQSDDADAASKAFDLMRARMGEHGPDLLYDLVVSSPSARERAGAALEEPEVRARTSAAVAIAHALRSAPSCAARLPLLPRAIAEGDARAIAILAALSDAPASGCGAGRREPCAPVCPGEAPEMRQAIEAIQRRSAPK
ncbi:MAG: serine/threonine protein kinase [Myxococcales bacterium]|nr:serine/threonine protein kinase [Myxococcales bacterium]